LKKGVSNNGTITNTNGEFTLSVKSNAILEISYIGYVSQTVKAYPGKIIVIKLEEATKNLDEVVVVGYGMQKVATLTGSVSQIKNDKLTVAPIGDVKLMLGGQLPGLVSKVTYGIPGANTSTLRIRGYSDDPLIIVDGIEGDFNSIDANQIESISILKDASASIYGARAGNGVILVTTKKGNNSKATISFDTSYTLQGCTRILKPGTSAQRAAWEREAWINGGQPIELAPSSEEDIQKYEDGTDPTHLNTDWFNTVIRKHAPQYNSALSIRGGNDDIKYFGYFGYNDQETLIKHDGGKYNRYVVQSNIDAKLADRMTLSVNMMFSKEKQYFPAQGDCFGNNNFWNMLYQSDPRYPLTLPDSEKYSYCKIDYGNPVVATSIKLGGYNENDLDIIRINASLNYDSKYITGLSAKVFFGFNSEYYFHKEFFNSEAKFYTYNATSGEYSSPIMSIAPTSVSEAHYHQPTLTQQYSLNYDKTFLKYNHVSAMLLFESINEYNKYFGAKRTGYLSGALDQLSVGSSSTSSNGGAETEFGRESWVGRLNYSFADKYLFEAILRADASSKFAKGHRWGYFPSVSLGWIISEESFMKNQKVIDYLKLRLSYGKTGNDNVGSFRYLTGFNTDETYQFGSNVITGIAPTGLANTKLTWEKMSISNVGLDFSLWNRKIYGEMDAFYRLRDGIPGSRDLSVPTTFGADLPTENINSITTRGFEVKIGTVGKISDLSYDISGNISWSRSKWKHYDEPNYTDPDQKRLSQISHQWIDRVEGYVSDGLFASQEEINKLPYKYEDLGGNANLRPGDIKYKDLNGDNVLNWKDQKIINSGDMPHWMYGTNLTFKYKGFDLSSLFQGSFGFSTSINFSRPEPTTMKFLHRWTEKNDDVHAWVPRPGSIISSNGYTSDFYIHSVSYLRLKYMALGYELPKNCLAKVGISKVRFYLAGTNLFTLSTVHKYGVDPEKGGANIYYPQQYTWSFGLNLMF
jgi:TonB-linked SusC/RagA family outer membrane protein